MNKIKIDIKIGNQFFHFFTSQIYEDAKIFRYAKSALKKLKIDYEKILKEELKIVPTKCPFCGSESFYNIEYNLNKELKILEFTGISYGYIGVKQNYHCKKGKKNCSGSLLNPNSISYISNSYKISPDEAREYILNRNKSPFYLRNHPNEEEYKKFQSRNLEWYISKYGNDEGNKKYQRFKNGVSKGNSKNALIEKWGEEYFYEISKKKAVGTLSHFVNKYGEDEGQKRYMKWKNSLAISKEKYIEKFGVESWDARQVAIQKKKSLDYLIQTLGFEEGYLKFKKMRESFSFDKEKYIEKYGEEKWKSRYKNINFYSKESVLFFELLLEKIEESKIEFRNVKTKENEFFIWDNEYRRIYFYDFYFEAFGKKIIIEYDNSFWHPLNNGNNLTAWDKINLRSKLNRDDKVKYDERKKLWARYKGYELISVYYDGKNPSRNKKNWDSTIEKLILDIKKILEC